LPLCSLAGRVAILNLYGLAEEERPSANDPQGYFADLLRSSFPRLHDIVDPDARSLYLSSYVQTYIERDVRELLGVSKRREFELFVRTVALRTGQIINHAELAQSTGVSAVTVKHWLAVLEDSFLIKLVQPFLSNRNKRLIKSPKLYFLDAGLAAYLAGWRDSEMLRLSGMAGAMFETQVFGQLMRYFRHRAREVEICFFRTRDGLELDFLVEHDGVIDPIEVKIGTPDVRQLPKLSEIAESNWRQGHVVSLAAASRAPASLSADWRVLGPERIPDIFARPDVGVSKSIEAN
jgi:uncharacterized protein